SLLIVAFVAWQLQRKLEESKDWEAEQVKMKESGNRLEHPFKTAFSSMVNVKSVLFLVGVYLFWNLVAGAMGFFMPFLYETVGGLSNTQANLLQAVLWILTAASTYFGFAKFGDRVSHRGLFFVGAL
ncbi:MFS transporter, partial [Escherichia coli]|nr:MFS transporter [Escherichia coli]